jgi:hypothetical protein
MAVVGYNWGVTGRQVFSIAGHIAVPGERLFICDKTISNAGCGFMRWEGQE